MKKHEKNPTTFEKCVTFNKQKLFFKKNEYLFVILFY